MENKPLISIIIPVYNVEQFLPKCLDSILDQTYDNLEIICINDGSTDNSGKIIADYAACDSRIVNIQQENSGVSAARNRGIEVSKGDYISFVDSDDYIEPDFYQTLISDFDKGVDVVQCGVNVIKGGQITKQHVCNDIIVQTKFQLLDNIRKCYIWNKLWRAELIKDNKLYFFPVNFCEDVLFTIEAIFYARKWKFINYVGYNYRFNEKSLTNDTSRREKHKIFSHTILQESVSFLNSQTIDKQTRNAFDNFLIRQLIGVEDVNKKEDYEYYKQIFGSNKQLQKRRRKAIIRKLLKLIFSKHKCKK